MNRYERLYYEHGVVPVLIFDRREGMTPEGLEIMFRAYQPCPCKNWQLDDLQLGMRQIVCNFQLKNSMIVDYIISDTKKRMKAALRHEAKKHIDEFLQCGTIDGERVN